MNRVADSHVRAEIAGQIGGTESEYYGKRPITGCCYLVGDMELVVQEETLTQAEKALIRRAHAPLAHGGTDPSTPDHALGVRSPHMQGRMNG